VLFAQLAFANETLYLFCGVGKLTPAGPPANPLSTFPYGQTFIGLGWLAKVSAVPQTTKVQAQNITLSLSGIPSELVLDAINQVRITGTATLWLGFLDTNGNLILDPNQVFGGALDVPTCSDMGDTCEILITCENPLLSLNLAPERRFNDTDQQIIHPGDLGFSFVQALANQNLFWPSPGPNSSTYPNFLTMSPQGADIAVGGTQQITVTMVYSDGTTYSHPGGGSGANFTNLLASSNPAIATVDPSTGIVTGRSRGTCSIMTRVTFYSFPSGGTPIQIQIYRAACGIIVHG
jgi:hypothetical protein